MAKYKEIVSMVLDMLRETSDDSIYNEEHIIFLAGRYRSFLLKQRYYSDLKKQIPESNYQTICLNLSKGNLDACVFPNYLTSDETVPALLPIGNFRIYPTNAPLGGNITLVTNDRFKYVGNNKWMNDITYAAIGADNHLVLKSNNPQFSYLKNVSIKGIFENAEDASELECSNRDANGNLIECDILDRDFPLEDALVAPLLELIVNELAPHVAVPEDKTNNANDGLSPDTNK